LLPSDHPAERPDVMADSAARHHLLRLRNGLSSGAGSPQAACTAADGVLSLDVVRWNARWGVQQPVGTANLFRNPRVSPAARAGRTVKAVAGYRQSRIDSWGVLVVVPGLVLLFSLALCGIGALPAAVGLRSFLWR
jgi:hypothetical protein